MIAASLIVRCCMMGQEQQSADETFQRLLSPKTTDKAATQLLSRAKKEPEARKYLAEHLPPVIEKDPKDLGQPWFNAVRLAGTLKIPEASSALAKWISLDSGGTTGMTISLRLDNQPAAKALAQIGDPAVPTLSDVLQHGSAEERSAAARALYLIGSAAAKDALVKHLAEEKDPELKSFIQNILDHWRRPS
jgi:hypothetical protein